MGGNLSTDEDEVMLSFHRFDSNLGDDFKTQQIKVNNAFMLTTTGAYVDHLFYESNYLFGTTRSSKTTKTGDAFYVFKLLLNGAYDLDDTQFGSSKLLDLPKTSLGSNYFAMAIKPTLLSDNMHLLVSNPIEGIYYMIVDLATPIANYFLISNSVHGLAGTFVGSTTVL